MSTAVWRIPSRPRSFTDELVGPIVAETHDEFEGKMHYSARLIVDDSLPAEQLAAAIRRVTAKALEELS